ncbi:hypothetical protein B0H13DRAFT_1861603 [Mycena leptocephala]|nr:hypothetical protein B0H13DRAFT_1861603 [Mycena leptocephala]
MAPSAYFTEYIELGFMQIDEELIEIPALEGSEGQFCLVCRREVKHQRIPQRFRRLIRIIFGDKACRESRADEAQCTAVVFVNVSRRGTVKVVALAELTGVAGGAPADTTVHSPSLRSSDSVLTAHERYSRAARRGLLLAMRKGDRTRPARNVQVSKNWGSFRHDGANICGFGFVYGAVSAPVVSDLIYKRTLSSLSGAP